MKVPIKPQSGGDFPHHADHHIALHERVLEGKGLIVGTNIRVSTNENGQYILEALPQKSAGQFVFMKACLEDGTECYVEVPVGRIFRTRADNPGTTPTIDPGKVPDGSQELI